MNHSGCSLDHQKTGPLQNERIHRCHRKTSRVIEGIVVIPTWLLLVILCSGHIYIYNMQLWVLLGSFIDNHPYTPTSPHTFGEFYLGVFRFKCGFMMSIFWLAPNWKTPKPFSFDEGRGWYSPSTSTASSKDGSQKSSTESPQLFQWLTLFSQQSGWAPASYMYI